MHVFKVALDNHLPKTAVDKITDAGFEVVFRAQDEHDELWFSLSVDLGANVFVSRDIDLEIMATNAGLDYVCPPEGVSGDALIDWVIRKLRLLTKSKKA